MFPLADLFGALALAAVVAVGATQGPDWGLGFGELIGFVFLVNLLLTPISELSEILDQTQTAIAGWRKMLGVLATPLDVVEPDHGAVLPTGPLAVRLDERGLLLPARPAGAARASTSTSRAGTSVAVVGETGSGKTTIAKLLCRLADPTAGTVLVGGHDLRDGRSHEPAPRHPHGARRTASCSTPPSPRTCASAGSARTTREVAAAFRALGLDGLGRRPARRTRGARRRAGREPLRRRAPARRPRPGPARRRRPAHPRRGDLLGGPGDRAGPRRSPRAPGGGPHGREHRPPALDRRAGRHRARGRRRGDRRARDPRRPGGGRRGLRPPVRELARQHPRGHYPDRRGLDRRRPAPRGARPRAGLVVDRPRRRERARHGRQLRVDRPPRGRHRGGGLRGAPVHPQARQPAPEPRGHPPVAGRVGVGGGRGHRGGGGTGRAARRPATPRRSPRSCARSTPRPGAASTRTGPSTTA